MKIAPKNQPKTESAQIKNEVRKADVDKLERRRELLIKLLWTVGEVAELTNLHQQTIYKAIEAGELTSAWICGKVLIPRDALIRRFGTNLPALLAALQFELGPMRDELAAQLDRNRRALLKLLWTAGELSDLTGLHPQTIYKAVETKDITSTRIASKILIPRDPFLQRFRMGIRVVLESLRVDAIEVAPEVISPRLDRAS